MSLKLSNITKSYGDKVILDDLDLEAKKGEVTALIGKNGVGKTTTFKSIIGLSSLDKGTLSFEHNEVDPRDPEWKRKLGYLSEHNPLYQDLYVKEFLDYSCKLQGIKNGKILISDTIERVGLSNHSTFKIKNLSKGYQQRVGLAQAIIHNPQILILDEPTTGLDPAQIIEIRSLIKQLSEDRIVILSSHILSEIEQICDTVFILHKGKASKYEDLTDEKRIHVLFDKDIDPLWFEHLGTVNHTSSKEISLTTLNDDKRGDIFDIAVKQGVKILEMKRMNIGLENQFLNLI